MAKATFGAGCFWGVEARFRELEGVIDTQVGYAGGHKENPTYKEVCSGTTGHAEVVEVDYDPEKISYDKILDFFWTIHDPTSFQRQGPDVGEQYRSIILTYDAEQQRVALESRAEKVASGLPVVTEIKPCEAFWRAEEYHQRYFEK